MPGEKKTILLDYNGTIELLESELIGLVAKQFELTIPKGVLEQIDRNLTRYDHLQKLCESKEINVDESGYLRIEPNPHNIVHNICESMDAYYNQKGKAFDYALVGTYFITGMEKLAKLLREKGEVVISPYTSALLLYHDGTLDKNEIRKVRGLLARSNIL